jgi:hypothetical protein
MDNNPAGGELIRGADEGLLGFSAHGKPVCQRHTGEVVDGYPLYEITESSIEEVSICLRETCADPAAIILEVGGRVPKYRQPHVLSKFRELFGPSLSHQAIESSAGRSPTRWGVGFGH